MRNTSLALNTLALLVAVTLSLAGQSPPAGLRAADLAWDAGDYVAALNGYIRLLSGPSADAVLEPIALQTGELYRTEEITTDGLQPRFSTDGRLIAYDAGAGLAVITRIVSAAQGHAEIAALGGRGAVFSPVSNKVAYLKLKPVDELTGAQKAYDALPQESPQRAGALARLNWLQFKHAAIAVRDLDSGQETELATEGLLKSALTWAADGKFVYFVGAREDDSSQSDIYTVNETTVPERITDGEGIKILPLVDAEGRALIYTLSTANPFRRPDAPPAPGGQQPAAGGPPGARAPTRFGIVNLQTRQTSTITGTAPTLSADGSTLAYLTSGRENALVVMPVLGAPVNAKTTTERLAAPALSADGRRVAFQMMTREDWEIYVVNSDGTNETRVTHEIQHDVGPQFVTSDLLLATMGEPRHRRSYLYDLTTLKRSRLFHNNTVRTIAPEYAWVIRRDRVKTLIGAERDGDTVSRERGIYLLHLDRRVTRDEVLARLKTNLAAEIDLRNRGRKMFQPIAADVRMIVAAASVQRVYEYEKSLFEFDSKHISKPGNQKAIEYLFKTYESFGYKPEYQRFSPRGALGGKTANVLATLTGTENPDLIYVVSSHFDSGTVSPGADDDSSGTSALLETARLLAGHPMAATIVFASFTGEEAGLLGSREWVRQAVEKKLKVAGALNNDTVGWANDHRFDNTIRYSNPGIRDVQHAAAMQFTRMITYDALYYKGTDANAYYDAWGDIVGGIGSYPVLGSPHYHQSSDALETINFDLVTEVAKTTVATLMYLASSPSRLRDLKVARHESGRAELTWTPSPEKGVREYIVAVGASSDTLKERVRVKEPRVTLNNIKAGSVVAVKAINTRGLEGWDWARATAGK